MKKGITVRPGDLIKIPLKEGVHTYARILVDDSYAILDCPSTTERSDFTSIIQSDILFTAKVDIFGLKEGYWTIVTNIPLEKPLDEFYPRYFNPAPTNPVNLGFYEVYKEEIEDEIKKDWIKTGKIQLDGIYGRIHIESRINAYYDGKRYEDNTAIIFIFKKYLGLPDEGHH